jgi:DNA repair exonuclease SbcCD ATPase subunit
LSTPFEPAIRKISIEAFRGFRERQEFDVAASVVLLVGPNGTGKTSVFDALQWCLLGTIRRLEGLRPRRTVEHIVNQYRLRERAVVEVEMRIQDRTFVIRRTGDHNGSALEFAAEGTDSVFGPEAEATLQRVLVPEGGLTLDMVLTTSGLLQQDVMRGVLEAKPQERYRHISSMLGLSALEDFEDAAREAASDSKTIADTARLDRDAAAAALSAAQDGLTTAQTQLQIRPRLDLLRTEIVQFVQEAPEGLVVRLDGLESPDQFRKLALDAGRMLERMHSYLEDWRSLRERESGLPEEPSLESVASVTQLVDQAQSTLLAAEAEVASARSRLDVAQRSSQDLARLASLAIPLLGRACPVCGQAIDPAHVERELLTRSSEMPMVLILRRDLEEAERLLGSSVENRNQVSAASKSLHDSWSAWAAYRTQAIELEERARAFAASAGTLATVLASSQEIAELVATAEDYVARLQRRVLRIVDTLGQDLDRGQLERANAEVGHASETLVARNQRLEELSQRARVLKNLADASVEARVEVTERRFKAVQPLVADIFSRLDPHPAFKTIEFQLDTYYRRGTTSPVVTDLVAGVTADPLVIFSTSQANIAALSYFLAMGWSAGKRALPFVLLDDPIQSMDDVNILGFADLCRHLRSSRQLIISTHERRFAGLLERKLTPRTEAYATRVLEFGSWSRSGPSIEARTVDAQLMQDPIRVVRAAS